MRPYTADGKICCSTVSRPNGLLFCFQKCPTTHAVLYLFTRWEGTHCEFYSLLHKHILLSGSCRLYDNTELNLLLKNFNRPWNLVWIKVQSVAELLGVIDPVTETAFVQPWKYSKVHAVFCTFRCQEIHSCLVDGWYCLWVFVCFILEKCGPDYTYHSRNYHKRHFEYFQRCLYVFLFVCGQILSLQ